MLVLQVDTLVLQVDMLLLQVDARDASRCLSCKSIRLCCNSMLVLQLDTLMLQGSEHCRNSMLVMQLDAHLARRCNPILAMTSPPRSYAHSRCLSSSFQCISSLSSLCFTFCFLPIPRLSTRDAT